MPPDPKAEVEGELQQKLQLLAPDDEDGAEAPAVEASDAPKTPVAEPNTPAAPAPEPGAVNAPAEELAKAQEALAASELQQDRINQQLLASQRQQDLQAAANADAEELRLYRSSLETQGYDDSQIQNGVQSYEQLQRERNGIAAQSQKLEQDAQLMQKGAVAKVKLATELSVKYGLPITNLMQYDSPEEMVIAGLKAQVASLTVKRAPAQRFDSEAAEPGASGNTQTRLAALSEQNGRWSDDQFAEAKRLRSG